MAKINLGGKEREFKLGTLAISSIEEDLNISFLGGDVQRVFSNAQVRTLISFIKGCLSHEKISKEEAADFLDEAFSEGRQEEVLKAIGEALENSGLFPKSQKKTTGKK